MRLELDVGGTICLYIIGDAFNLESHVKCVPVTIPAERNDIREHTPIENNVHSLA